MNREHEHPPQESLAEKRWPIGRAIIERIRAEVNDDMGPFVAPDADADVFRLLYLTERDGCIPNELLDEDLINGIRTMYYAVLDGVREELRERLKPDASIWVLVDPSYEDATNFVVMTDEKVLLFGGSKAWHFYWESEEAMAQGLEDWYQAAAPRLKRERSVSPTSEEGWYAVTLQLERKLRVAANDAQQALERAGQWRNNEDDDEVRLVYDEITDDHVEAGGDDVE